MTNTLDMESPLISIEDDRSDESSDRFRLSNDNVIVMQSSNSNTNTIATGDESHVMTSESSGNTMNKCPDDDDNCRAPMHFNTVNRPFFTLPRLLSGRRKRMKRKTLIVSSGESRVTSIEEQPETESIGQTSTNTSISYRSTNIYVKENFFIRLMRHLASPVHGHNAYYSDPNPMDNGDGNGSATMRRRSKRESFVSSASNGDINRSQYYVTSNNEMSQKPNSSNGFEIPAICGIKNHGNTCFMSAIIQCLCNTDLLAEYFVMNHYRIDLLRHNKLHARKYGTKGEVTEQLALLLKSLWSCQYTCEISSKFKLLVSKYGSQYDGNEQHDAQEFLLWLLDKCHEDLNIANKKKYKKIKALPQNRNDEVIAAETLANYMRCNSSFVHDLFQAQLRSSLVCRSCGKHSNTFDPYQCLSLPVPTRLTHTLIVTCVYLDRTPREVKIGVSVESLATLRELRDKISRLLKVPEKQLVLLLVGQDFGLKELIRDSDIIQEILDDLEIITAIETPKIAAPIIHLNNNVGTQIDTSATEQMLTLVWTNRVGIGSPGKLFGPLFSTIVSREASYKQIQLNILNSMKMMIKKNCDISIVNNANILRLRVIDGIPGKCYLPEDVDHPLYMPTVDKALNGTEDKEYRGPIHLKLIVEWDLEIRLNILIVDDDIEKPVIDSSIEYVKERSERTNRATLHDCFQMYFKEEKLAADNAWMCPACKRRQQCIKKLSLWSVPDIFIVHLKRFRHASNSQRTKLSTLVLFPLTGLDMTSYLAPRPCLQQHTNGDINNTLPAFWSPWKRPRMFGKFARSDDNVFELYAVCNHHGTMHGGHYTAYCKNPIDGCWYSFDDTKVSQIQESSVITADAYILFYHRSSLSSAISSCASSSTSGYSSSASSYYCEHWAFRMPPFNYWSPKTSKSQDSLYQSDNTSENGAKSESTTTTPVSRGQRSSYSSVPLKNVQNRQSNTNTSYVKTDCMTVNLEENTSPKQSSAAHETKKDVPLLVNCSDEISQNLCSAENETPKHTDKYWTITSV